MEVSASRYDRRIVVQRELATLGATLERIAHAWKIKYRGQQWLVADLADLSDCDLENIGVRN